MNYLKSIPAKLLGALVLFTVFSCNKNTDLGTQDPDLVNVSFNFSGFTSETIPLTPGGAKKLGAASATNATSPYLYFWSFNNSTKDVKADIFFDPQAEPTLIYADNENINPIFSTTGYPYEGFASGKSLFLLGHKEILVKMPIVKATALTTFGFDLASSSTGPKAVDVYYSINKGQTYEVLALNNKFQNPVAEYQYNSFSFDLSKKNIIGADELWVKIVPQAGDRGTGSAYDESGLSNLDNVRLLGSAPIIPLPGSGEKLYYYLFNKDTSKPVISGVRNLNGSNTFSLEIPKGEYDISFVVSDGNEALKTPIGNYTKNQFYVSTLFSDYNANVFGYNGTLNVSQDQARDVVLERLFSQVKIEFTDTKNLDRVNRIIVTPEHNPFYYAPFNTALQTVLTDNSKVNIVGDFTISKQVVFNQFLGKTTVEKPVSYKVEVYGVNGLLRTLSLKENLQSNVQLTFKGEILEVLDNEGTFSIVKSTDWKPAKNSEF